MKKDGLVKCSRKKTMLSSNSHTNYIKKSMILKIKVSKVYTGLIIKYNKSQLTILNTYELLP